ncbi:hypothetical protein DPMN_150923 [Dreissena polymorpha]|uniref:Uncharacterized protein n=1 Tax=Dreissena polymorpha TaxID=45954 RepID=A0A9D4J611_DREPO|nr:hypothetical protein DPMN_150923 [Dreissena polymorpha]
MRSIVAYLNNLGLTQNTDQKEDKKECVQLQIREMNSNAFLASEITRRNRQRFSSRQSDVDMSIRGEAVRSRNSLQIKLNSTRRYYLISRMYSLYNQSTCIKTFL